MRALEEAPGMGTTEGFEGSPTASVQIFVPSLDGTNFPKPMMPNGNERNKQVRDEELGVSAIEEVYISQGSERSGRKRTGNFVCVINMTSVDPERKADSLRPSNRPARSRSSKQEESHGTITASTSTPHVSRVHSSKCLT